MRCEGERHQQLGRRLAQPDRRHHRHRHKRRDRSVAADQGAEAAGRHHDDDQQPRLPGPGLRDQVLARLERDDGLADDEAFMPMHWSDLFTARGGVNRLVAPVVDPFSGQPQFKQSRVQVRPFDAKWLALWVGQHEPQLQALGRDTDWWSRRPVDGGECRLLADASSTPAELWQALASKGQWLKLAMPEGWVAVQLNNQRIAGLMLCGNNPWKLDAGLLAGLLATPLNLSLLASTLEQALAGESRMVCSCMRVSEKQIVQAIVEQGINERSGLQSLLKCGTNCGTCVVEIDKLLNKHKAQ